jgi:hypothetical protein
MRVRQDRRRWADGVSAIDARTYNERAEQHRPTDVATLRREVCRLNEQGLRIRDIAQALRLNDYDVAILLAGGTP